MIRMLRLLSHDVRDTEIIARPHLINPQDRRLVLYCIAPACAAICESVAQSRLQQPQRRIALRRIEVAADNNGEVSGRGLNPLGDGAQLRAP